MRSVNKVIVIGHLTRTPEIRQTTNGHKVATFSLATNRVWKDVDGQRQEATDYIDCVAWSGLANVLEQYVKVGQAVYIEGQLRTRSWEAQDGSKRHKTEVVIKELNILTWKEGDMPVNADESVEEASTPAAPATPSAPSIESDENINIEDIPF